ncbi:hypothetical protein E3N88_09170 [Mikania micrantha]|uniref:Uncharacterized protein n=1 Tax=Mikania micrantha TaxID=192012 RepID=A0A5N6PID0_9ASTR|nr:hypothetical protein E3N88_09170 [Mikania micrantha]
MAASSSASNPILCASFNQDYSCFVIGTKDGFRIFASNTGRVLYERVIGAFVIVEMLFSSSLLAIVGAGEQASLSPRRLCLFNTETGTALRELNFLTSVLAVFVNRKRNFIPLVLDMDNAQYTTWSELSQIHSTMFQVPDHILPPEPAKPAAKLADKVVDTTPADPVYGLALMQSSCNGYMGQTPMIFLHTILKPNLEAMVTVGVGTPTIGFHHVIKEILPFHYHHGCSCSNNGGHRNHGTFHPWRILQSLTNLFMDLQFMVIQSV